MTNIKRNVVGLVKATLEDEFVNINTLQQQVDVLTTAQIQADIAAIELALNNITATIDQYGLANIINLAADVSNAKTDISTLQENIISLASSLGTGLSNYYGDMGTFATTTAANIDLGTF